MAERINLDAIERQVQRWVYPTDPETGKQAVPARAQKLAPSRKLWLGLIALLTARNEEGQLIATISQRTALITAESLSKAIAKRQTLAYQKNAKAKASADDYVPDFANLTF